MDERHPVLFKSLADHVVGLDDLGKFNPQDLSNVVWAFTLVGAKHPLFRKVAYHIKSMEGLDIFKGGFLSKVVWLCVRVGKASERPVLMGRLAYRAVEVLDDTVDGPDRFGPESIADLGWGFLRLDVENPGLFNRLEEATRRRTTKAA